MAKIIMVIDGQEYLYGTYPFVTSREKNEVNALAMRIRDERSIEVYVKEVNLDG